MTTLGKIDTITKEYMRNPAIFADAFNKFLYHGRQVIKPDSLKELDTTEITLPYGEGGAAVPEQKYRDVLKLTMTDGNAAYCIMGIEDQNFIHYAMPVRNMVYDALQLAHQVTEAAASHKRKTHDKDGDREISSEEYLSGFYKTDKLLPVITLTIYWGADRWDGPLSLKEMYASVDESIMRYVPDYTVNLISPEQMSENEINEFKSSLKQVMLYIKHSKDKARLQEVTQADPAFKSLDRQAAEVINVTTNSKLKYPEGKERIDMCAAIEQMRNDSRLEGIIEGKIEGAVETCKEFNVPLQETIRHIAEKFGFSMQQAEEEVNKYWQ